MALAEELSRDVGVQRACAVLGVSRATLYRRRRPKACSPPSRRRPLSPRALTLQERETVLEELHSERFVDKSPAEVHAILLDQDERYLCSTRTMYRILASNREVRERRAQRRHPKHPKPVLVARAPNQVWSWDITKLRGPEKWLVYYLYVVMDIFSRYVVGWLVAESELALLAERLILESCRKQGIDRNQLTVHADRGSPMTAGTMVQLYAMLGITRSHSRPRVSNDNPYSESQFKTLKYQPGFPGRFGGPGHARSHCADFMNWYNLEHHHSGLALLTPAVVHYGHAPAVLEARQRILDRAYAEHPERFVQSPPRVAQPPKEVWINRPERELTLEAAQ